MAPRCVAPQVMCFILKARKSYEPRLARESRQLQYFGGRRLGVMDQLGSAGSSAPNAGSYFPWGEPRSGTGQDTWNFATYWADSATGLDYANNRYYSNAYGRFMTVDPSASGAHPSDPQTWNRYAYTGGDPVNRLDPGGLDFTDPTTSDGLQGCMEAGDYHASIQCDFDGGFVGGGASIDPGWAILWSVYAQIGGFSVGPTVSSTLPTVVLSANAQLADALKSQQFSNCAKVFGISSGAVTDIANSLIFLNGNGQGSMNMAGGKNNETFAQYHGSHPSAAGTTRLTSTGQASNMIVLWADYFKEDTTDQDVTLIHEFMHSYFDLTKTNHQDIIKRFGISQSNGESATQAIDAWIKQGCSNGN